MKQLVTAFAIFLMGYFGLLSFIATGINSTFAPIQYGLRTSAIDFRNVLGFLSSVRELANQNTQLRMELVKAYSDIADYQDVTSQNLDLKAQLGVQNQTSMPTTPAKILARSKEELVIDKGSADGVKVGDNVVYSNHMVGLVTDVSSARSVVKITTSPQSSISAKTGHSEGVVVGNYGVNLHYKDVLQAEALEEGAIVYTSSKDGKYLPDFILGKVVSVEGELSSPVKSAEVISIIDIQNLVTVFVVEGI